MRYVDGGGLPCAEVVTLALFLFALVIFVAKLAATLLLTLAMVLAVVAAVVVVIVVVGHSPSPRPQSGMSTATGHGLPPLAGGLPMLMVLVPATPPRSQAAVHVLKVNAQSLIWVVVVIVVAVMVVVVAVVVVADVVVVVVVTVVVVVPVEVVVSVVVVTVVTEVVVVRVVVVAVVAVVWVVVVVVVVVVVMVAVVAVVVFVVVATQQAGYSPPYMSQSPRLHVFRSSKHRLVLGLGAHASANGVAWLWPGLQCERRQEPPTHELQPRPMFPQCRGHAADDAAVHSAEHMPYFWSTS